MLSKRYEYDGKAIIPLNQIQQEAKARIISNLQQGHYKLEKVPCAVCEGRDFENISGKDRYGLPVSVVICRSCGLIQENPRLTQKSFDEFYKTGHTKLIFGENKPTENIFLDQYFHSQTIYRYMEKFFHKNPADMFVLEVGCGAGGILAYFADRGCRVTGVDLDDDCIRYGREKYSLDLRRGTLAECSFERKPDVVILSHVLEHFLRPYKELTLIRSLINTGGLVYIEIPGVKNMTFIHNDLNFLRFLNFAHTYHFTLTTLKNILGKAGFEIIRGDEKIRSLFKPATIIDSYQSDYRSTISYLRRIEIMKRCLPITPYRVKNAIESVYYWLLRKTGLYYVARAVYRRMIGRTEPKCFRKG